MWETIGTVCITMAILLDVSSYRKQIQKTLRAGKSSQVSSTALLYRAYKYIFALCALAIYSNWVGFIMQTVAFLACLITLLVVAKKKPKGWRLF